MRFFTPALYLRFNSPDDAVADAADAEWEAAAGEYRAHLDGIREHLPTRVRELAELNLHDAELLRWQEVDTPVAAAPADWAKRLPHPYWLPQSILSLRQGDTLVTLIYHLADNVRTNPAPNGWPFSKVRADWLYDEVDVAPAPQGSFLHRVFLSDGRVLEIPFASVVIHTAPLRLTAARHSA